MSTAAYVGAAISAIAGVLGLCFPRRVSAVIGLHLPATLGVSEVRATYGGLFLGAGVAVMLLGSSDAALVLGTAWLGAFGARAVSVVVDRSRSKENVAGLVVEATIGALLVLGR
ncbi:MAG: DUF4345 family protein [Actinomycetota bacterium]